MSSLLSQNKDEPLIRKSLSDSCPASSATNTRSLRHERLSRLSSSSSSDVPNDTSTNHAESYFLRRENRLSARKKAEEEMNSDYKKMYEKALATNERLKSRLETSKQDLATVKDQLHQAQGSEDDCSSHMLEAEKKESWSLKKRISDMEEQLKVKAELKQENQRLKDENGALIRVITKLSK
ncbi:protein phosphatase 1 regulatory subunit 12B-like isoform X2 [Cyprinodon tularosa]|uniref:protein phosphatase 1 regulatory subunit 12B-like isoform X2 n=1 Tax=Cyprinodon variegatus TaxID=28743 RepID=UPI000742A2C3|nr:PREDICTED: protein phosphatase 1 regulatory subunit 12B-like isoform X2 [Cyprinodon variegatus]XP_038134426.1 protein phosphatase 1 regulatory subunit 12B-like isoform X2 [Cyprinodon tularosa]